MSQAGHTAHATQTTRNMGRETEAVLAMPRDATFEGIPFLEGQQSSAQFSYAPGFK